MAHNKHGLESTHLCPRNESNDHRALSYPRASRGDHRTHACGPGSAAPVASTRIGRRGPTSNPLLRCVAHPVPPVVFLPVLDLALTRGTQHRREETRGRCEMEQGGTCDAPPCHAITGAPRAYDVRATSVSRSNKCVRDMSIAMRTLPPGSALVRGSSRPTNSLPPAER